MRVLTRAGCRIPDDAVIGIDDIEEGQYSTPSLTRIAPDKAEIARRAVDILLQPINSAATTSLETVVPTASSSGRAPGADRALPGGPG
ncbi:substrate-binding domain-containing protein [Nonomuraea sp. NEAU-A123]|uniref:substrate-binding domain-containing protein n=1 Tax=Nonomuraea sp. NEAU-A123 TaxID=2839649 RepID=UPI001BE44C83|nr:substrate-binding domain-containing protein [Nonomuraea sp. NEAU-A123]MBT2234238.1 substrate-binding domain-containing protein [Nonomuraea sp. NEAU-A123]